MDKLLICFLLTVSFTQVFSASSGDWSYNPTHKYGPTKWGTFNKKCAGKKQSPINITTASVMETSSSILGPLILENDWKPYPGHPNPGLTLTNKKGKTVQLDVTTCTDFGIKTKQHDRTWHLAQFHLHWSMQNGSGSEHTINGMAYPAEIHFVHFNRKYGQIGNAVDKPDGLMVMGFFIEIGNTSNAALTPVFNALANVTANGSHIFLETADLYGIVKDALGGGYYNYMGSLTTPTCDESVNWNVFRTKLTVTLELMNKLRAVEPSNNGDAARFRPVQPVNDRVIRKCCQNSGTPIWQYDILDTLGPVHWGMVNVQCDGKKQSPINIKAKEALENKKLKKLKLHASWNTAGSRSSKSFELKNKGYTVQLDIGKYEEIQTTQNGKTWRLEQFHLHWSHMDTTGSEHTVDEKAYPGEIHFVHYNPNYDNISEALGHEDGLMVMGFFLKLDDSKPNTALDSVFSEFQNIKQYDAKRKLKVTDVKLQEMVSDANGDYYHYSGSLTTPTCNEVVTWNVMKKPIYVSSSQLRQLRELQTQAGVHIRNRNRYRPVQALNNRKVESCCSSAYYVIDSFISVAIPVIALLKLAL